MNIKTIASLAGVSTATVSYVMNNTKNVTPEIRERVLRVIAECGYQPNHIAKSLRINSTHTIGVVVEDVLGFPVPSIINGISEYAEMHGYKLLLNDLRLLDKLYNQYDQISAYTDKINDAVAFLLNARVDGVIFVDMFDRDVTGVVNPIDKPLVFTYCTTHTLDDYYVTYDSEQISREAVNYLIQHGHERIAVITGLRDTYPCAMRMSGIRRAFAEAGFPERSEYIRYGDWEYRSGYAATLELMRLPEPPSAIFAMNDLMAVGTLDAARALGLDIPRELSVLGFDNRELCSYVSPNLTTVQINLKQIGLAAAETAISLIRGEGGERQRIIPSTMVYRDSVTVPGKR